MNDVFDEVISRLKQKAKSGFEVIDISDRLGETCNAFNMDVDRCYQCLDRNCEFFNNKQWVRLEDVKEAIQQLKQNYVLVEKHELEKWCKILEPYSSLAFPKFLQDEMKELLRKNEG